MRILNRSPWRAERLRERLQRASPDTDISVHPLSEPRRAALGVDVVVNATYLGLNGDDPLPIPANCLEANMTVCDAVYIPGGETGLIQLTKELGLRAVPGKRMLLYQGV